MVLLHFSQQLINHQTSVDIERIKCGFDVALVLMLEILCLDLRNNFCVLSVISDALD